ncbi:MAG TPA: glycosyltransferase family 2 protein [Elusimicrobiota bacterium]|nr:glycosyltransferase family 2 protein [Elusimicrobiota bacterium]
MRKLISIVSPCYNEEHNIQVLYGRVSAAIASLADFEFEMIFIDNASTDGTVAAVKKIIEKDKRVRLIVNARNFGHIRSPFYGLLQAHGDAVILMASDLQDPPELIGRLVAKWTDGFKVAAAIKNESEEARGFYFIRKMYYEICNRMADIELISQFTGFGLYDKEVIGIFRTLDDPYPYLRGLVSEIGFEVAHVPFKQPVRERGITKNNFYTLFDMAMLGITSHSRVPIRLATFAGFALAAGSLCVSIAYIILKLIFWNAFKIGTAPILVSLFFFAAVQLIFLGLIGEYIGVIRLQTRRRPLVVEKQRINFPAPPQA